MALTTKPRPWTHANIMFVRQHYGGDMTAKEIANKLGRTESSIRWKASELGLTGLNRIAKSSTWNRTTEPTAVALAITKKPWWKFW